jgi:cryptochrome
LSRLSCTAFFSQFYRCYSPIAFPKKWDSEGHFVRKYVPELAKYDKKYIYEPHKAPIADQKKWGCVIKGDGTGSKVDGSTAYPKPMLDFNEKRQFCIDQISEAYHAKLYGNDKKVLDGSWKDMFHFDDKGARLKDEALGDVEESKGTKRGRGRNLQKQETDDGEDADVGDATDESPPRKVNKKSGSGQETLDNMVSRGKRKTRA